MRPCNWLLALALCAASVVSASATPIAPNPSDPALQLWFKADSITGANLTGTSVNTWNDSSSNANNLNKIGTAPTYVTGSPGTLNGQPYVEFNATGMQSLSAVSATLTGNPSTTVFIVLEPQAATTADFGWGDPFVNLHALGAFTGVRGSDSLSIEFAGNNPAEFGAGTTTQNSFQIIELQKTPGAINTTSTAFVNGGSALTPLSSPPSVAPGSSTATPAIAGGNFYLGQFATDSADNLHGGVAEVIVYNSVLSSTDSANITEYLNDKYFVAPTPEPATLSLMLLGAIALVGCARRSCRKACR